MPVEELRSDDRPDAFATRQLHLEHLQSSSRTVQAERISQSHPAADGFTAIRLSARADEGRGA